MRQIGTKEIFYQLNWSLLCRPWKKGRKLRTIKQVFRPIWFQQHPILGLIMEEIRSERVVDVLGRAERADVHLGGEEIINTSGAWRSAFRALFRSILLYILWIYSNRGYIPAIWPWFWFKWLYNRMNWCCCNDFWPIASIGRQTALYKSAELGSLWLQRLFKYEPSFIHCAKNCLMFVLQICDDSVCTKTFFEDCGISDWLN